MDEMASLTMKQTGDCTCSAVRHRSCVLALPSPPALAGDKEEVELLLGDGEQTAGSDEEDDESYDSDDSDYSDEEEESDGEVEVPLKIDARVAAAAASGVRGGPPLLRKRHVPEGRFLGPAPRFASEGNTAGFLGVAVVVPPADGPATGGRQEQGVCKEIVVLYRYTEFEVAHDGVEVEVSKRTKLHYLRFAVPPSGDTAGSLQWAGASLAPLIYPALHSGELQALWSRLVSSVGIPPRTTCLKVIADIGILRLEDYTRERMDRVSAALEGMMAEPWPGYHVAMELRLPEPVHVKRSNEAESDDNSEDADCGRPAKRRKVVAEKVAEQECPVCFENLDSDVVVWPGCSLPHVFHGACLEKTLKESEMCPMCRRKLSAPEEQV